MKFAIRNAALYLMGLVAIFCGEVFFIGGASNNYDSCFTYDYDSNGYYFKGEYKNVENVIIPETYKGENVVGITSIPRNTKKLSIPKTIRYIESLSTDSVIEEITVDKDNPVFDSRGGNSCVVHTSDNKLLRLAGNQDIPSTVEIIGTYSIRNDDKLYSLTLGNNITTIESSGIYNCPNLEDLYISRSVTDIATFAFSSCPKISNIVVDINNPVYDSRSRSNAIIKTETDSLLFGSKNTVIPEGVVSIENFAFNYIEGLYRIDIPSTVTEIASNAFRGLGDLDYIYVDEDNAVFDSRGDCNCLIKTENNSLLLGSNNSTIPDTVKMIQADAFKSLKRITSINVPSSVEYVYSGAFSYCPNLERVSFNEGNKFLASSLFDNSPKIKEITIPASVTYIGSFFCGPNTEIINVREGNSQYYSGEHINCIVKKDTDELQNGIKTTIIPSYVKTIGSYAFDRIEGLKEITIPGTVQTIETNAFYYCTDLETIRIEDGLTTISGRLVTYGTTIYLPHSISSLYEGFVPTYSYYGKSTVYYDGTKNEFYSLFGNKTIEIAADVICTDGKLEFKGK